MTVKSGAKMARVVLHAATEGKNLPNTTPVATFTDNNPGDTAASLTADLKEFRSAIPINDFLARLLLLLAENKISPRRAAVLAYITNQLLRTLPAIDRELNPKEDPNQPPEIVWDMPGPKRDRAPAPEPTYADVRT